MEAILSILSSIYKLFLFSFLFFEYVQTDLAVVSFVTLFQRKLIEWTYLLVDERTVPKALQNNQKAIITIMP